MLSLQRQVLCIEITSRPAGTATPNDLTIANTVIIRCTALSFYGCSDLTGESDVSAEWGKEH